MKLIKTRFQLLVKSPQNPCGDDRPFCLFCKLFDETVRFARRKFLQQFEHFPFDFIKFCAFHDITGQRSATYRLIDIISR